MANGVADAKVYTYTLVDMVAAWLFSCTPVTTQLPHISAVGAAATAIRGTVRMRIYISRAALRCTAHRKPAACQWRATCSHIFALRDTDAQM
jgi:hypothetical protein